MSDVKLTLEPELETPAPGIPTLTLDGVEEEKPVAPEKKEEEQPEVQLTPEEQKVVTAVIFVIYYLRGKWLDRCIKREHDPQHGTATEA